MADPAARPRLVWDHGTAYDFFTSLHVIHNPGDFGLRASWAAGIRSRISAEAREVLALAMSLEGIPIGWIRGLPQPKDARSALDLLETMDPRTIVTSILLSDCGENPLRRVAEQGRWEEEDLARCGPSFKSGQGRLPEETARRALDLLADPAALGAAYRRGLGEYYEGFFREEERRILPELERALERAQEAASRLSVAQLFAELSRGIRVESHLEQEELVLVPCWWGFPRILYADTGPGRQTVLFGARPPEASLIPGDAVPGGLLLALEALSDPTRLAILRALAETPMTQADLARKLRLRPPTISHHLKHLRLAGLIEYIGTGRDETRYGARMSQIEETAASLKGFFRQS